MTDPSQLKSLVSAGNFWTFDFETKFDSEVSLDKLGNQEYVEAVTNDIYLVSITGPNGYVWLGDPEDFDWWQLDGAVVAAHNMAFDEVVLSHLQEKGVIPAGIKLLATICTADLAAYMVGTRSLQATAHYYYGESLSKEYREVNKGMGKADFCFPVERDTAKLKARLDEVAALLPLDKLYTKQITSWEPRVKRVKQLGVDLDLLREYSSIITLIAGEADAVMCRRICSDLFCDWPDDEILLSNMTREQGAYGVMIDKPLVKKQLTLARQVRDLCAAKFPWADEWVSHKFKQASVRKYLRGLLGSEYPGNKPAQLIPFLKASEHTEIKEAIGNMCFESSSEFGKIWKEASWKTLNVRSLVYTQCTCDGIPQPASMNKNNEEYLAWLDEYGPQFEWVDAVRLWGNAHKAVTTLETALRRIRTDGTMPFGLKYFGAHTGRWSGTQKYNMQNPLKQYRDNGKPTALMLEINKALGLTPPEKNQHPLQSLDMRGIHIARPRHKFIIRDLGQIEPRVKAWLAKDWEFIEACKITHPYIAGAVARGSWKLEDGDVDFLKETNLPLYSAFKMQELQLGYQSGHVKFIQALPSQGLDPYEVIGCNPSELDILAYKDYYRWQDKQDRSKGLRSKFERMELEDPRKFKLHVCSWKMVKEWREANPKITSFWALLQDTMKKAVLSGRQRTILEFPTDPAAEPRVLASNLVSRGAPEFVIRMPSGRELVYHKIGLTRDGRLKCMTDMYAKGDDATVYEYGGKLTENCLAKDTEVLTDDKWKPIQAVELTDKLWDGDQWVEHDGVVCKGKQKVMDVDGVWLTPEHEVFIGDTAKVAAVNLLFEGTNTAIIFAHMATYEVLNVDMRSDRHFWLRMLKRQPPKKKWRLFQRMPKQIVYDILNAGPKHRFTVRSKETHQPLIVSNCVQALSRDVFAWQLARLCEEGISALWSCHDEGVFEVTDERLEARVKHWMETAPPWMPGLVLDSSGIVTERYEKG